MSASPDAPSPLEPRYQPLVIVLAAAVVGILFDRYWPAPLSVWGILALIGFFGWLGLFIGHRDTLAGFALLLAVAAAAGSWHHCRWHRFAENDLSRYVGKKAGPVCVDVIVLSAPRTTPTPKPDPLQVITPETGWRFDVEAVALRNGATWQPVTGRSTIFVRGDRPEISAGNRVRCYAKLSAPPCPLNPGQRDWAAYLRTERIRCQLMAESPECLTVLESGSPWTLTRLLGRLRSHGDRMFQQYLDPRQAELASAVLLGLREEIDQARSEAFLTTGTVHILSISGLHVGILAGAFFWLMRRMPIAQGWSLAAIALTTLLYTMMVDAEPPVVRSTVLVLVACMAIALGREAPSMNALAAAALVVLALNPAQLFSVGAQLSFLCVAGLIWCAPHRPHYDDDEEEKREGTKKTLDWLIRQNLSWPAWLWNRSWRSVVGLTLAGLVLGGLTFPLVAARFHILSLVSLLLNVLLWIPMTLSVLFGFVVLLFGSICWPIASLFGWLCNGCFFVLEWGIDLANRCPYGHFWVSGFADGWLWVFYGGLGMAWALPRFRPSRRACAALAAGWLLVGFAPALWPRHHNRIDCTFLSVGHGSGTLLELPSGRTLLYDAGRLGGPTSAARTISEFLWDRGIRRLDTVVLSHPDLDHYNALPGIMEKFPVGEVWVSPRMFQKDTETLRVLRRAMDERGVPVRVGQAGDRLINDNGCTVDVLYPRDETASNVEDNNTNAGSMVLAVAYRGRRILLPGDLESYGLADLLSHEPMPCEVLLAPHHGSRKSNSPELAAWCKPRWVVFSGDGRWSYPEIEAPYRAVGGHVFHTHADGAITVQIDAEGLRASPFVQERQ